MARSRTGTLRRSWNMQLPPEPIAGGGIGFTGKVGSNLSYARYQDLGFHGTEQVRAHTRRTPHGNVANVRAHSRAVDYAGHHYTEPALTEAVPYIQQYHEDAINRAIEEANA